jgi:hypothetical protein
LWFAGYGTGGGAYGLVFLYWRGKAELFWSNAVFTAADALFAAAAITDRNIAAALFFTALGVISALATWWTWRRRKRRGRLAAIGAKSRARIAAMAARMRERPARPVLRPVPRGT